jgi:hypothetical protein
MIRVLTIHNVANVQFLAWRLILEKSGFLEEILKLMFERVRSLAVLRSLLALMKFTFLTARPQVSYSLAGLLTISLTQDALWGGYDVRSEKYTFNVAESGTLGLILVGIG